MISFAIVLFSLSSSVVEGLTDASCYQAPTGDSVVLTDLYFFDCQLHDTGNGAGVMIDNLNAVLSVDNCEFRQCLAHGQFRGGAIFAICKSALISRLAGEQYCYADEGGVFFIEIGSSRTGAIHLNNSYGFDARAGAACFYTQYREYDSSDNIQVVQLLNATQLIGTRYCSTIWVGTHYALLMHYCIFVQNSPFNTLVIEDAYPIDTFTCLQFVQNHAYQDSARPGLINVNVSCVFRSCLFVANNLLALVGGPPGSTVWFENCIFDTEWYVATLGVVAVTKKCTVPVNVSLSLTLDPDWCQIFDSIPPVPTTLQATPTATISPDPTDTPTESQSLVPSVSPDPTVAATERETPVATEIPNTARAAPGVGASATAGGVSNTITAVGAGVGGAVIVAAAIVVIVAMSRRKRGRVVEEPRNEPHPSTITSTVDFQPDIENTEYINPVAEWVDHHEVE
jgi:hypothetical protein